MEPITQVRSITAVLPQTNVDTDQIIPARFLTVTTKTGLGKSLFADWRYLADGSPNPQFVLNQPQAAGAKILVAGDNFGCGSSREHAPWALLDFGIRCVIAPSFADIFYNNCFKNGILPIKLPQDIIDQLTEDARNGANARLTIDLPNQRVIRPDGQSVSFEIDAFHKHCLIHGLDEIGLTMAKAGQIDSYETRHRQDQPWLWNGITLG